MAPTSEICPVCQQKWTVDGMVSCDECKLWFHYACVGVNDSIADEDWLCHACGGNAYPPKKLHSAEPPKKQIANETAKTEASSSTAKTPVAAPTVREPTVAELMLRLERQQEREAAMVAQFEEAREREATLKLQLDKMTTEFDAIKSKVEMENAEVKVNKPQDLQAEYQRLISQAESLEAKSIGLSGTQATTASGNKLDELAVLMKQAQVEDLPKFSGDIKSWPLFLQTFKRTTRIASIDDDRNVGRLNKALHGEARELVLDKLTFGINPNEIIETLEKQYGRKDVILLSLSNDLMRLPGVSSLKDPNLRKLALSTKTYVAQLKALDMQAELRNSMLVSLLHQKLSNVPSIYRKWASRKLQVDEGPSIEIFANFLMSEWETLPSSLMNPSNDNHRTSSGKPKSNAVNVHSAADNVINCCLFCNGKHETIRCFKFQKLSVDERWNFVKKERICFVCLASRSHRSIDCASGHQCSEAGCGKPHNRLLHCVKPKQLNANAEAFTSGLGSSANALQPLREQNLDHQAHSGDDVTVNAKIVPVRVFGANGAFVDDFAFLDDGSSLSMMDRQLADKLRLRGEEEKLHLRWTKGITRTESATRCDVRISGIGRRQQFTLNNVFCVPNLDLAPSSQDGVELSARFRHLRGFPLPSFSGVRPKILIGLEHASFLGGQRIYEGKLDEPLATNTKLGWVVYGRHANSKLKASCVGASSQGFQQSHHLSRCESEEEDLHQLVKGFFAVESLGVNAKQLKSKEDERAEEIMQKTLRMVDGHYECGLLWKSDDVTLPNDELMAMKRLISEEKKLSKDPDSLAWLNEDIQKLLAKKYARIATEEDLSTNWTRKWICPFFITVNKNKIPPKRRRVSDVAAKEAGVSLNTCLISGPDNLIALPVALCRARENPVMITADVAEMFHQVKIIKEDQQCQRFIWRDGDATKTPTTYIMEVMMFGPTCSPFQAQYVKNQHAEKYRHVHPEAADALVKFMYMDDYFNSHDNAEDAVRVTKDAIKICSEMGFDLVQVQSNNSEVLKEIPERHIKQELVNLNLDDSSMYVSKLLGMFWSPREDAFVFRRSSDQLLEKMLLEKYNPTKREVLSAVMKIFDPLGLIAKYVIRGKMLLQEVWRLGIGWDENLPEELADDWLKFLKTFDDVEKIRIPRWYGGQQLEQGETELVTFVDASAKAFAAVCYFRFLTSTPPRIALVMAKSKVAPVKTLSVPRLELEAAKLGARLATSVGKLHSFPVKRRIFLSDSKCVLSWIHSKKFNFVPFVAHRVSEILELTSASEWMYVPTDENVADEATKITDHDDAKETSRWLQGPEFLRKPETEWPTTEMEPEMRETFSLPHQKVDSELDDHFLTRLRGRFTKDWPTLVRITAQIKKVAGTMMDPSRSRDPTISLTEQYEAEKEIFRFLQRQQWGELWNRLVKASENEDAAGSFPIDSGSKPWQLLMRKGERIIRLNSRDKSSKKTYGAKNLILLPKNHAFVQLYWQNLHERNYHMGIEGTIADAREKVWIIAARQSLYSTLRKCQFCKNRKANPTMPDFADLHASRTAFDERPFKYVGADCFGHIMMREKRSEVKRWGLIFTCLTFRAVHLEVVEDLSADQILLAIRRLIARRGSLKILYSDNGRNFVGANSTAKDDLEKARKALREAVAAKLELEWHFIPAYSPWMGGAWERLIGYVKTCLKFMLAGEVPTQTVLTNALIEAEMLTNKRPLTHTPVDPNDEEPLTPNIALHGSDDDEQTMYVGPGASSAAKTGRKRVAHLAEKYRLRWEREYLPIIAKRDGDPAKHQRVKLGDVVLLAEGENNRDNWKLGRVVFIHPTKDSVPRIVDVKMGNGEIKKNRSVGNLAVLDVGSSSD